jgi:hypothetical protein
VSVDDVLPELVPGPVREVLRELLVPEDDAGQPPDARLAQKVDVVVAEPFREKQVRKSQKGKRLLFHAILSEYFVRIFCPNILSEYFVRIFCPNILSEKMLFLLKLNSFMQEKRITTLIFKYKANFSPENWPQSPKILITTFETWKFKFHEENALTLKPSR